MNRKCPACGAHKTMQSMSPRGRSWLWQCLSRDCEASFFDGHGIVAVRDAIDRINGRPPTKEQTSC